MLSIAVSYYQQYCHYQFEVLKGNILRLPRAVVRSILGGLSSIPPHLFGSAHPCALAVNFVSLLEGMEPPLYMQQRSLFTWVGAF